MHFRRFQSCHSYCDELVERSHSCILLHARWILCLPRKANQIKRAEDSSMSGYTFRVLYISAHSYTLATYNQASLSKPHPWISWMHEILIEDVIKTGEEFDLH